MQQSKFGERFEGRRLDLDAAEKLSRLPYEEFLKYYLGRSEEPTATMSQALMLRVIELHYANKALQDKLERAGVK